MRFFIQICCQTRECIKYHVSFTFKQTGANFVKNNKLYHIPRSEQLKQARKANIDLFY